MGVLNDARRHSAGGIQFPAKSSRTRGSIRHKLHEYPRQAGANTEKQGRKVWIWTVVAPFHEKFRDYPTLFPGTYNELKRFFENEETFEFVHPVDGTYNAWITDWDSVDDSRTSSGVEATLTFQEDTNDEFRIKNIARFNYVFVAQKNLADDVAYARAVLAQQDVGDTSIFDTIIGKAQEVFAIFDQAELGSRLLQAKIEGLIGLVQQADATAKLLTHPDAFGVVHSLGRLMETLGDTLTSPGGLFDHKEFNVPRPMSIAEISAAIYGDATHVDDLLSLNVIDDASNVPAGVAIRYL